MKNRKFTPAELFLIENWGEAIAMEKALKALRKKFAAAIEEAGQAALQSIRADDRDHAGFEVKYRDRSDYKSLVVTKKEWPSWSGDPSGLWFEFLDPDCVYDPANEPSANIWLATEAGEMKNLDPMRNKLKQQLPKLVGTKSRQINYFEERDRGYLFGWEFSTNPEMKRWTMTGDMNKIRDRIREHLATFLKIAPQLDREIRAKQRQ